MKVGNYDSVQETEKVEKQTPMTIHIGTQCKLEIPKEKCTPAFTISDSGKRRSFVRRLYSLLILQNLISLFAMEIFIRTTINSISSSVYTISSFVTLFVFLLTYFIRHQRRKEPLNYLFFVLATVLYIAEEVIFAKMMNTELVLLQPVCMITQLTFLTLYSKLYFIKFTNCRGVIIVFITCSLYLICMVFWPPTVVIPCLIRTFIIGCYIIYDTQLMMTGQHGYELEADEYIFAVTNIYADWAIFWWRLFKFVFLNHFIEMFKFLRKYCSAEVC